ncbi:helix-turn-helix transcriptional regulator, partial [bacterium]|nr:helix-turn-helix transcriptional regulator [bacterium]
MLGQILTVEELRKRKGWTVSQLGRATGLDRRLLTDLERGIALAK